MINLSRYVAAPLAIAFLPACPTLAQTNSCRQTTSQLDIYARPDRGAPVIGSIPRGDRVTVSSPSSSQWTPITVPQDGYILSRYLEACSGSTPRLEDSATLDLGNIVVGCGQVADLGTDADGSPQTLPLYSTLGDTVPFDAIAPRGILALGPSIQRNGRYWVSVLAYQSVEPEQAAASPTGIAWAAESGPNVPADLLRDATNNLVYPNGREYIDLAIIRRPCLNVFGPAITEDQRLPSRLPAGYQTP